MYFNKSTIYISQKAILSLTTHQLSGNIECRMLFVLLYYDYDHFQFGYSDSNNIKLGLISINSWKHIVKTGFPKWGANVTRWQIPDNDY